ncbi:MAG: peptidylprolyl isomerase [Rikenellaceae bacterium]
MKIAEKTFVSLAYELTVDGQVADKAGADQPLSFPFGMGYLLPEFEKNILGLEVGGKVEFTLSAENGYGEVNPEAVVELDKAIFMIDGKIEEGILDLGTQLPMSDNQGNRMVGTVKAVSDDKVTMDFNHPMAGKTLNFAVEVLEVRDVTPADLMPQGGGCGGSCGGGCGDDDCGCDSKEGEGCSCGCN